jgi:hypothetical protein
MIQALQGGEPRREIFPLALDDMEALAKTGIEHILYRLEVPSVAKLPLKPNALVGAALRPDGTAFYLTTVAPDLGRTRDPLGRWRGGFFAPFGVADLVGTVEGDLRKPGAMPTSIRVAAWLLMDAGKPSAKPKPDREAVVSVEWEVIGNQATRQNKACLIGPIVIHDKGPHDAADLRRCIALHAPQRAFGEARAVIAMQCGIAAACLLEGIC